MGASIRFRLNGCEISVTTDSDRALLWVLRSDLGLTGTKFGCGANQCGACTVIINGEAVRSCQYPVRDVSGKEVLTIEGLAQKGRLHPLQKAFVRFNAIQCGFCTPGMILRAYSLLLKNRRPSRSQIVSYMDGNLCRCSTYPRIVDAIQAAAAEIAGGK